MAQEGDVVLITGKDDISQFFSGFFVLFCCFQACLKKNDEASDGNVNQKDVKKIFLWREEGKPVSSTKIGFLTLILETIASLASREFPPSHKRRWQSEMILLFKAQTLIRV